MTMARSSTRKSGMGRQRKVGSRVAVETLKFDCLAILRGMRANANARGPGSLLGINKLFENMERDSQYILNRIPTKQV